jgi:hypothetical protein
MSNRAHARDIHREERRPTYWQGLRLVEAETQRTSRADTIGLALIALVSWFIAALIFVPQLAGLL